MIMTLYNEIKKRLNQSIDITHLEIFDDTGKHIKHRSFGGGAHLSAVIVSSNFNELTIGTPQTGIYRFKRND